MRALLGGLALGLVLGCNSPAPVPPTAPKVEAPTRVPLDATPTEGPEEVLPAARTVDAKGAACGPFTMASGKRMPVLGGRLEIAAVDQAKNDPRPWNVMSAPEPDEEETRLIAEVNGKKLVVLISEVWQTDPGPRALKVKMTGRDAFEVGPRLEEITKFASAIWDPDTSRGLSIDRIATQDPALTLLAAAPAQWVVEDRPGGNATIALGAVAILPDSTLVTLAFYSNETDPSFLPGCRALAEGLVSTLAVGKRKLDLTARKVTLAPTKWSIDLPEGYVVTHQPGPDFQKFTVRKLRPLGLFPGQIMVVDDRYPEDAGGPQTVQGTLLGAPTTWTGEFDDRGGQLYAKSPRQPNGAFLSVGINATRDVAYLDEFRKVAESIR